jgi:hypothetical protein
MCYPGVKAKSAKHTGEMIISIKPSIASALPLNMTSKAPALCLGILAAKANPFPEPQGMIPNLHHNP